jgi:4-amino-4-deoxy-L-arabinose transferase-like glycosyltransferase
MIYIFTRSNLFLFLSITILLIIKIPHLGFPFSWDESWSYYQAILRMAENGPTLLPGNIELIDSRGHPLLFYFVSSVWINILPGVTIFTRVLPLLISVAVLVAFYQMLQKQTNPMVAAISTLLLSVQSLFLAQASLLLPEMMLTLWLILSLHFYLERRFWWFAFTGTLMVLTKETGVFFVGVFGLVYIIENLSQYKTRQFWINGMIMAVPLMVYGLFLLLHARAYGTFFFTEHFDYIYDESNRVVSKLKSASSNLTTRYGRNTLSAAVLLSLAWLVLKKNMPDNTRFLLVSFILIVSLIAFSAVNFFTHRYMLPAMPLFIALGVSLIYAAFGKRVWAILGIAGVIFFTTFIYSMTKMGKIDNDLGYTQYLKVHKELVNWCEENNKYDKKISSGFNMVLALRDNFNGYLTTERGFVTEHLPRAENSEIIVWDSTCTEADIPEGFPESWEIVFRASHKKHWGEIYLRKDNN